MRFDEPGRAKLAAKPGASPCGLADRPMGGYVTLPRDWTARQAKSWIATALATATALPPKRAKKKAAK